VTAQVWQKNGGDRMSAGNRSDTISRRPVVPFALAERHDFPGQVDGPIPGEAAAVEDTGLRLEDAVKAYPSCEINAMFSGSILTVT
jgi:hypothetical protein